MNEPEKPGDLGVNVSEKVKADEKFGQLEKQMKGVAGTLYINHESELATIPKIAWQLSEAKGLPCVIVLRAPRKVT